MFLFNNKKNLKGVTLVEALVAISVFSVASAIISAVFLNVNALQQDTANFQRLQNDGRYIIEKIAREFRGREVNYQNEEILTGLSFKKDESQEIVHICFDEPNKSIKYYLTFNSNDGVTECLANGHRLNADDVQVSSFSVYVAPTTEDLWGATPTNNIQPRATILIKLENDPATINARYQQELILQTTISSKVYKR